MTKTHHTVGLCPIPWATGAVVKPSGHWVMKVSACPLPADAPGQEVERGGMRSRVLSPSFPLP